MIGQQTAVAHPMCFRRNYRSATVQYCLVGGIVTAVTFLLFSLHGSLGNVNLSIAYLFIVLGCAIVADPSVTLFCGLLSFLCYDFFLVPPIFTFGVNSP